MKNFLVVLILFYYCCAFGQNHITINNIQVKGNIITKYEVIERELSFNKGESYSVPILEKKMQESTENLQNLELFNFINIQRDKNTILITVIERWYFWPYPIIEISERNFNTWWNEFKTNHYSDFSRLNYGIFFNWENFRGRNELLQFKIRRGFKEHYLFSYQLPYFNKKKTIGINTNLELFRRKKTFYNTLQNELIYYEETENYTSKDYSINIEFLYRKNLHKKHKLKFYYFQSIISDSITTINPNYLSNSQNSGSYFKTGYQFTNEHRDYTIYPLNGYFIELEASKYFNGSSPVENFELKLTGEKYLEPKERVFLGTSFKFKLSSENQMPYFSQEGFGFIDYVRGYEHYVIDGQQFWLSKTALKYAIIEKTNFDIPYVKMKQFKKSHYSIYLGIFSDMGYIYDYPNTKTNLMDSQLLWGKGVALDYVTYYDKILRIEYSINHLGEKGVFLHFSNPFGSKK
ncbi:MAG: hypothetical protein CMD16_01935 [Flavobacteriales bacterium]|nr:hypothetical protein [Flavobacteriales bacterium]|tara:strand:- start:23714 stop:25099 length:1386 start_codon:yes stop_codon:yes gene_type:complete